MDADNEALRGWKEIAGHLRASERTVMRWERTRGLPVYRVPGRGRDAVFARKGELDTWVTHQPDRHDPDAEIAFTRVGAVERARRAARGWSVFSVSRSRRWLSTALATLVLVGAGLTYYARASRTGETASPASSAPESGQGIPAPEGAIQQPITLSIAIVGRRQVELGIAPGRCGWVDLELGRRLEVCARRVQGRVAADVRVTPDSEPSAQDRGSSAWRTYGLELDVRLRVLDPVPFDLEWVSRDPVPPAPTTGGH